MADSGDAARVVLTVSYPPRQWGERISAGNSTAAAESVNTNADSRTTRPAGTDASPT
jgi:hypothetical protein